MKLTKKLFIAIMTMALLVVTFGTTTFAWFTLGQESKIDNVKVQVMTGTGMEISEDGQVWKNNITLTDAATANIDFVDLTSPNGVNIYKMQRVNNAGDPALASNDSSVSSENKAQYFEKVFYVRITNNNTTTTGDFKKVILESVSGKDKVFGKDDASTESGTNMWLSDATLTGTSYSKTAPVVNKYYRFDALNAVKVSFTANGQENAKFIYGYENSESWGGASATGLARDYADAHEYDLTNAYPYELATGVSSISYTKNTADTNVADGTKLVKYDGGTKGVVLSNEGTSDFGNFASLNVGGSGDDVNYIYAKLTIRIWLEGWDNDCINAILEQNTVLSFVLKGVTE